jgi:hypothetical protein
MTDWKATCAGLLKAWEKGDDIVGAMNRARSALAEGAGVGVTDEELLLLIGKVLGYDFGPGLQKGPQEVFGTTEELVDLCRAVLALATNPRPIPVAERLPTAADCAFWPEDDDDDIEPWCWQFRHVDNMWEISQASKSRLNSPLCADYTHWLPAAAIPLLEASP